MNQTVAFLDSCILYPFSLRDILLQFSVEGMFQSKWSSLVREEVIRNVESKNPSTKGKLSRTFDLMEKAIPDFSCEPSEKTRIAVTESTTDAKDVDILVAAIDGNCTHLVTFNLKHFDIAFASARGVTVIHPDEFLSNLIRDNYSLAKTGFDTIVARHKKPPRSKTEYCNTFHKIGLVKLSQALAIL